MPTAAAIPVKDFALFVEAVPKSHQHSIQVFLAELSQVKGESEIERVCLNKVSQLKQRWENPNTLKKRVTHYRNSIRAFQQSIKLDSKNSFKNPNGEDKDVCKGRTHFALKYLSLSNEFYTKLNEAYQRKTDEQRDNCVDFDPFAVIKAAEAALKSESYLEQAAALEILTGRRPTEVLKRKGFKLTGRYTIEFSGQLKKKAEDVEPYEIYTLTDANKIVDAIVRLNRECDLTELDEDTNETISRRRNSALNTAVRRIFKAVLPPPLHEKQLSSHNLRAAYVQAAAVLFKDPKQSMSKFAQSVLGHSSVVATVSYEDYVCLDESGQNLPFGQWRHKLLESPDLPESKRRTSVTLDGLRLERIHKIEGETNAERLDKALDAYEQQPTLLNKIEELERQIRQMSKAFSAGDATAAANESDKWTEMSSDELKGCQIPGSAEEKIRRAVKAIMEFNEDKPNNEKYRMSEANVRYLSGSRHGAVKAYFRVHPELNEYNDKYGFGLQHDRGKADITGVISW